MTFRAFATAAAFLVVAAPAALARDAVVSTRICEKLAPEATVQISPADDTALYKSVEKPIRDAVTAAGHPVAKDGQIELYYSIHESPVRVKQGGGSLGRLEVRTIESRQHALLLLNVWSTSKDSVLGGKKTKAKEGISTYLLMAVELSRNDNGRCVWRGEGAAEMTGPETKRLATELAAAIMRFLGQAVSQKPVVLD